MSRRGANNRRQVGLIDSIESSKRSVNSSALIIAEIRTKNSSENASNVSLYIAVDFDGG
jgi:hypothetical protein